MDQQQNQTPVLPTTFQYLCNKPTTMFRRLGILAAEVDICIIVDRSFASGMKNEIQFFWKRKSKTRFSIYIPSPLKQANSQVHTIRQDIIMGGPLISTRYIRPVHADQDKHGYAVLQLRQPYNCWFGHDTNKVAGLSESYSKQKHYTYCHSL